MLIRIETSTASWTACSVVAAIIKMLSPNALFQSLKKGDRASNWVRPQENTTKVTVDTLLFTDPTEYGFGLIIGDSTGQLVEP